MLQVNLTDNSRVVPLQFRNLKIGDVFIVMSSAYPGTRSPSRPNVYLKTGIGNLDCNVLDLTEMRLYRCARFKEVKLVSKAELNIEI